MGVYQDGWLAWAGFDATGGLKWTMVHSTCGFLFALAMDYDLFLFARVYERRQQGYDNASAVRLSLEETGPLITLAGTIMVISFAFVFLSSVPVIAQIGSGLSWKGSVFGEHQDKLDTKRCLGTEAVCTASE